MQAPQEVRWPSRSSGLARWCSGHGMRRDSRKSHNRPWQQFYLTSPKSERNNLRLNNSKIKNRQPEVKFMGHVITNQGLKTDPKKVKAIEEMPRPTCRKELATLLGYMNYLSKFLPWLTEVARPLCELRNKEAQFLWSPQHNSAFTDIKQLVINQPVLMF